MDGSRRKQVQKRLELFPFSYNHLRYSVNLIMKAVFKFNTTLKAGQCLNCLVNHEIQNVKSNRSQSNKSWRHIVLIREIHFYHSFSNSSASPSPLLCWSILNLLEYNRKSKKDNHPLYMFILCNFGEDCKGLTYVHSLLLVFG